MVTLRRNQMVTLKRKLVVTLGGISIENIEKSASELLLEDFEDHELFKINALTIGLNYTILKHWNTNLAIGAQGTLYSADSKLDSVYGDNPKSLEIYMRISPGLMNMNQMKMK